MKILQLIQRPQLRGAEVFTSQLSTHLNMIGHEALMVSVFPGKAELPFDGKKINLNGKEKSRFFDFKAWRKLSDIIKKEKPAIVQANAGDTLKYAVFSKLFFRWKQPITFRNASTISQYIKTKPALLWNSFFFKYAAKIISVSKVSAQDFGKLFPKYYKRVVTVPIGIEATSESFFEKSKVSNGSSLLHEGLVLLHVGGFTHEKNHKGLISIFEKILLLNKKCSLHLFGDGILRPEIEVLIKSKKLEGKICLHGQKPALPYIHNADILLLPSLIEGLPGVILEAFYCKTPVVAYNVGGVKELVINNETGYLIKKDDEDAFALAVLEASKVSEKNKLLIENAFKLVNYKYMNDHIVKEFLSVYESILV